MDKELQLLLPLMEKPMKLSFEGYDFHSGRIGERQVTVMKCGIGKVNAALGTLALIEAFHPRLIINTGVAGGASAATRVLDVVVGTRVCYHDVWCGPGTVWGQAAGCPEFFESDSMVTTLPALQGDPTIHHGLICSGDIFVDSPAVTEVIRNRFPDVLAVDMESGAIAQTCYLNSVRYACVRVLSDTPGSNENNTAQYEHFWDIAPKRTFLILRSLLAQIPAATPE